MMKVEISKKISKTNLFTHINAAMGRGNGREKEMHTRRYYREMY